MARALTAFVKKDDVPSRKALQGALDPLGFRIVLDEDYKPFKTKGYVPVALDGEDAGFDLRFDEPAAEIRAKLGLADGAVALAIRWGGDPREELAALAVLAALAQSFGAAVAPPGAEAVLSVEDLLVMARKAAQAF
ncbi:hypothetical protein K9U39_01515 [Rhodoblastus acidophilus]|uniref:Uncharacterized protein n=1 Tax=Candidatus Rhodoblastus alkanivorans TaxID=2954117 RepID=A0ABS9Z3X8_9HYPH|nr:hypothetical protein [Candidatus Rhodoblastus alkanivorans]MCI4680721.1 hypothetical protein [Candidatus Rhodoblastus alkanivorans]MCI4682328.1 hypothetical protein [Candidatus Rhodoblastus alkanivorans]MDI4639630.1 hypothetical protein [Rhodoblastus acidophilus]